MARTRQKATQSTQTARNNKTTRTRDLGKNPRTRPTLRTDISTGDGSLQSTPRNFGFNFTGLSPFNRGVFTDPFFSDMEDLFHINPFNFGNTMNDMCSQFRNRALELPYMYPQHSLDPDRTNTPGSYSSKSQYTRRSRDFSGKVKGELITQDKTVYVDDSGKKYIDKTKTYEDEEKHTRKTTKAKFIGDKGVKTMITENLDTGEEYVHDEYKNMNENQLRDFNDEFTRGVRNASKYGSNVLGSGDTTTSPRALGSAPRRRNF
jgi:hypothetical protein